MPSYIKIVAENVAEDWNPTPQQKSIYRHHDANHSDQADDIYSGAWYNRTRAFLNQFAGQYADPTFLDSWEMVEKLNFGAFFLAHPIAGYAFWSMLKASFELDTIVCGTLPDDEFQLENIGFQPFVYLQAEKIRSKWEISLKSLRKEIDSGSLEGDAMIRKIYDIIGGVENLQQSLKALKESFEENLPGMEFVGKMLEQARSAVDGRLQMIERYLNFDNRKRSRSLQCSDPKTTRKYFRCSLNMSLIDSRTTEEAEKEGQGKTDHFLALNL